jgi:3-deoxy-D-manno-octulosonic-acid transferase
VVLVIQYVMHLHHIVICSISELLHCLINGRIFEKSYGMQNVFLFSVQLLSENFLILKRTERDKKMYICLHMKCPLFFIDFNET